MTLASEKASAQPLPTHMHDNPLRRDTVNSTRLSAVSVDMPPSKPPLFRSSVCRAATVFAVVVLVAVGIGVAIFTATSSHGVQVPVPEKFTAKFSARGTGSNKAVWTGEIMKTPGAHGTWSVQGKAWMVVNYSKYQVTLTADAGYLETFDLAVSATTPTNVTCYSSFIPPFKDLGTVFSKAVYLRPMDLAPGAITAPNCAGTDRFLMQWGDSPMPGVNSYEYCQHAKGLHQIASRTMVADVFEVNDEPSAEDLAPVTAPIDPHTGNTVQCEPIDFSATALSSSTPSASAVASTAQRRRLSFYIPPIVATKTNTNWPASSGCGAACKRCVFVPGLGSSPTTGASWSASDTAYWGSLNTIAANAGCNNRFLQFDFSNTDWDDNDHLFTFCSAAVTSGSSITNTVIISHGTGGAIVAKALKTSQCNLGTGSSWISVSGTFGQNDVAAGASSTCQSASLRPTMIKLGGCAASSPWAVPQGMSSLANDAPSQSAIENTVAAATGTMCGTRTLGIDFDESADFGSIAISAMGIDQNDGFVLSEQCAAGVPASSFVNDAGARQYAMMGNFLDTTCRNGDALVDPMLWSSPCVWYGAALRAATTM